MFERYIALHRSAWSPIFTFDCCQSFCFLSHLAAESPFSFHLNIFSEILSLSDFAIFVYLHRIRSVVMCGSIKLWMATHRNETSVTVLFQYVAFVPEEQWNKQTKKVWFIVLFLNIIKNKEEYKFWNSYSPLWSELILVNSVFRLRTLSLPFCGPCSVRYTSWYQTAQWLLYAL